MKTASSAKLSKRVSFCFQSSTPFVCAPSTVAIVCWWSHVYVSSIQRSMSRQIFHALTLSEVFELYLAPCC